jgi:hypothetical protein
MELGRGSWSVGVERSARRKKVGCRHSGLKPESRGAREDRRARVSGEYRLKRAASKNAADSQSCLTF